MTRARRILCHVIALNFIIFSAACTTAPASIQMGPDAEVTFDGLHRVDNARADAAWARPDIDLSGYTKLMVVSGGFSYTPTTNRGRTQMDRNRGGPYFVDDAAKARFEAVVSAKFREELAKIKNWTFASAPGPDVLTVSGSMLDITSYVPPNVNTGRSEIFLRSIGEATLVLELRDSETNTVLARSVDRRAAERMTGDLTSSNRVTNENEIRRLIQFWARRLVESLDGFKLQANDD